MPNGRGAGTIDFFRERQCIEAPLTARLLRAIPADKLSYRPHPDSQTAGTTAWTIVRCLRVCNELANNGKSEMLHDDPPAHAEIVEQFDKLSKSLAERLSAMDQNQWVETTTVTANGSPILQEPLGQILWLFLFDAIHHRGQLSTYLRPLGAKVPSIYGKSGDESAWALLVADCYTLNCKRNDPR